MKKEMSLKEHMAKARTAIDPVKKAAASKENGKLGGAMPHFAKKVYEAINVIINDCESFKDDFDSKKQYIDESIATLNKKEFSEICKVDSDSKYVINVQYAKKLFSRFCTENNLENSLKIFLKK